MLLHGDPTKVRVSWNPLQPRGTTRHSMGMDVMLSPKPCQGRIPAMLAGDHHTDSPASLLPRETPVTRQLGHIYHWFSPEQELRACNEIRCSSEIPRQQMNQTAHFLTKVVDSISAFILSHCSLSLLYEGFAGHDTNQEQTEPGWVSSKKKNKKTPPTYKHTVFQKGLFHPRREPCPAAGSSSRLRPREPTLLPTQLSSPLAFAAFCEGRSVLIVSLAASSLHR